MSKNTMAVLVTVLVSLLSPYVFAQHKGISFQAIIKDPDEARPTATGLTVTLQILDPVSNCVLREEEHTGVNISNGYINLVVGGAGAVTPVSTNPAVILSIPEVLDNSKAIQGFGCTYNPLPQHGRKLRLKATVPRVSGGLDPVTADFNMRAVAYAVNSESLNGKSDLDFIQKNNAKNVNQVNVESIFDRFTKLDALLNNSNAGGTSLGVNITGNATTATTATSVTGTVAIANGGTGATSASGARTNLGLGTLATVSPTGTADNTTYLRGDGTWATKGSVDLSSSEATGILTVAKGGTGTATGSIAGTSALDLAAGGTNQNVTLTPSGTGKVEIVGQVKITGGAPGAGKVLTSDAAGLATWETPSGSTPTKIMDLSCGETAYTTGGGSHTVVQGCSSAPACPSGYTSIVTYNEREGAVSGSSAHVYNTNYRNMCASGTVAAGTQIKISCGAILYYNGSEVLMHGCSTAPACPSGYTLVANSEERKGAITSAANGYVKNLISFCDKN